VFAELHCISNFSFLRGASHPEELVLQAAEWGYRALAITDECSLAGVVRAHLVAQETNMKLIVGTEVRLADAPGHWVLLAPDATAYRQLCHMISDARLAAGKGNYHLTMERMQQATACCLLWRPPLILDESMDFSDLRAVFAQTALLAEWALDGRDETRRQVLEYLHDTWDWPVVASNGAEMHQSQRLPLRQILAAIAHRKSLQEMGRQLPFNAARSLRPVAAMKAMFPDAWIDAGLAIAESCSFSLDSLRYRYPGEVIPDGKHADEHLAELTWEGARWRWPDGIDDTLRKRIQHELELIKKLAFAHYFLTVHDIVRFARSRGILCQGRGSAANSVVCFCLGITSVDPKKIDVLFERFISEERHEPPDIDIDFEHERREEVMQYLYRKYGRHRAALTATVTTYRHKSAIRDVGKALGLPKATVERIARRWVRWRSEESFAEALRDAGLNPESHLGRRYHHWVQCLLGFPRHLSQHVGGFVLSDGPIHELVPLENAAMDGRTVIQWDKDDIKALGLMKVDILSLGMLTALRKAMTWVGRWRGRAMELADIPPEDPAVYRMLQKGDSMGVFQVESRAQMAMLPRLKPRCFYDLVIEIAIVRPGPIQGDMVHPYLRRRLGQEAVSYPNDAVRQVLERTLGIPIFQEQVIKLAMVAAGFTAGEADQLRRAMATWRRHGSLDAFRKKLIDGMTARGHSEAFAERIFAQIRGFGEYGFPESHAASFALLVYASAWLKCHEPALYCCALLNSQPMGFYAPSQLIQDAQRHGVRFLPVDVRESQWDHQPVVDPHSPEGQPAIRLGFRLVKGLPRQVAQRICALTDRHHLGGVHELAQKARLTRADLSLLADAGALNAWTGDRHRAAWKAWTFETNTPLLQAPRVATPELPPVGVEDNMVADYRRLGMTLGLHPVVWLRNRYMRNQRVWSAEELKSSHSGQWVRVMGLVTTRQRPGTASGVVFLTLEDETGHVNLVIWPSVVAAQEDPVLRASLLQVHGIVEKEGNVCHVVAGRLMDRSVWLQDLAAQSRDFH
jgi:error-prone DNA polymerase